MCREQLAVGGFNSHLTINIPSSCTQGEPRQGRKKTSHNCRLVTAEGRPPQPDFPSVVSGGARCVGRAACIRWTGFRIHAHGDGRAMSQYSRNIFSGILRCLDGRKLVFHGGNLSRSLVGQHPSPAVLRSARPVLQAVLGSTGMSCRQH
jgi:hypothetical protein